MICRVGDSWVVVFIIDDSRLSEKKVKGMFQAAEIDGKTRSRTSQIIRQNLKRPPAKAAGLRGINVKRHIITVALFLRVDSIGCIQFSGLIRFRLLAAPADVCRPDGR